MPTRYPKEFRDDMIAVARKGDQSIAKVARSFGISESCLAECLGESVRSTTSTCWQCSARTPTRACCW